MHVTRRLTQHSHHSRSAHQRPRSSSKSCTHSTRRSRMRRRRWPRLDSALYGVFATGGQGGVGAIFVTRPQADGTVITTYLRAFARSEGGGVQDGLVEGTRRLALRRRARARRQRPRHRIQVPSRHRSARRPARVLGAGTGRRRAGRSSSRTTETIRHDDRRRRGRTAPLLKLTPAGILTTLHAFSDGLAWGLLVQAGDGNLYGANGAYFFRLTLDGTRTVIHSQAGTAPIWSSADSIRPRRGSGWSSVPADAWRSRARHLFQADARRRVHADRERRRRGYDQPRRPLGGVDGSLLGTLPLGGANDRGTLFRLTTTGTFNVLAHLHRARRTRALGHRPPPERALLRHDGTGKPHRPRHDLFGRIRRLARRPQPVHAAAAVRAVGAARRRTGRCAVRHDGRRRDLNLGTVYRLGPSGFTVLHNFTGNGGAHPIGKLVLGPDGRFYARRTAVAPARRMPDDLPHFARRRSRDAPYVRDLQRPQPDRRARVVPRRDILGTTLQGGASPTRARSSDHRGGRVHAGALVPVRAVYRALDGVSVCRTRPGQDGNSTARRTGRAICSGHLFWRHAGRFVTRLHIFTGSIDITGTTEGPKIFAGLVEASDGRLYGGACCGGGGGFRRQPTSRRCSSSRRLAPSRRCARSIRSSPR